MPYCLQHKIKILILISPVYPATFWLAVGVDWTVEEKKTRSQEDTTHRRLQHKSTSSNSRVTQPAKEYTRVSSKPRHNLCHWSGDLNIFCFLSFGAGSPSEYLHGRTEIHISLKQWRNREVESTEWEIPGNHRQLLLYYAYFAAGAHYSHSP